MSDPKPVDTPDPGPRCRSCGMTGGPWPKGDRPKSRRVQSGCPRCGFCY